MYLLNLISFYFEGSKYFSVFYDIVLECIA